ncbi:MAG: M1 family aminopeptidase [Myxococcaceae bacterium]
MHFHRSDEPHPFALESATEHYAADRPVRPELVSIDVELDFAKKTVSGKCATRLRAVRKVTSLDFDAVDLDVEKVEVDGKQAHFTNDARTLRITLNRALEADQRAAVAITYSARPRRGLYFHASDSHYKRPAQAWTQGQDEDSRHWFPCLDTPAQKAITEVKATFPAKFVALSNGEKLADTVKAGKRTVHYRLDRPHSPYLVTLAVGEFEEHVEQSEGVKLRTLFPKGKKADAIRCVGRTGQMVRFFEDLTGQQYPWGSYAQVFVTEFIFGGMENTGATTLTDSVLHDARAHLDFSAEPLISHELAHQWFGDLLTCRDWSHGWLNEGFATYSEVLWKEHADNNDEGDHQRRVDLELYLSEAGERYQRAIVAKKFDEPIDLFDRHLYEKGALVLHELRTRLGDAEFRKAVRHYVASNREGSVETVDLARAVEQATGRNLDKFFDQYVMKAGHPSLKVSVKWEAEHKWVRVQVTQTQADAYALTLKVELVVGGKKTVHPLDCTQKEHVFRLEAAQEPSQIRVDPRRDLLATLEVEKAPALWRAELLHGEPARNRTEAAAPLGKDGSAASIEALATVLKDERAFWGTRNACARALAVVRTPEAKAMLLEALKVRHPKVRRSVVAALGVFRGDIEVAKVITQLARRGDESLFVEAEAARVVGRLRAPGAFEVLSSLLKRETWNDTVLAAALDGLAELHDPRGFAVAQKYARYGAPQYARRTAVMAVARLAEVAQKKREAVEMLGELLRDSMFRVQMGVFDAAKALGERDLIGALAGTPFLDGRAKRAAREAIRDLRKGGGPAKELSALRTEVDGLKSETKKLKEELEGLKKKKK